MKQCSKCKEVKPPQEFNKNRSRKDGLHPECKACKAKYRAESREQIAEYNAAWRAENPTYHAAYSAAWRAENRDQMEAYKAEYRAENRERIAEYSAAWRAENPAYPAQYRAANREQMAAYRAEYRAKNREQITARERTRRRTDTDFRLRCNLRCRLNVAIRSNAKTGSAVRDLGCSIAELWLHLESQFQPGMDWENYGTVWHIDHIYPLAEADLSDRVEFLAVNNWRNLQPLTGPDNERKGNTVTPEAQRLFDELVREFSDERKTA